MTDSTDNARGPELLPCPFCGGDDQYLTEDARDHGFIGCHECHARGPIADQVGDWTRPYTAWNRRADLAPDPLGDPRVTALVSAAGELSSIIEGIQGAFNHGTWRDEKNGMRLKDTNEWVTFYDALASLSPTGGNADGA